MREIFLESRLLKKGETPNFIPDNFDTQFEATKISGRLAETPYQAAKKAEKVLTRLSAEGIPTYAQEKAAEIIKTALESGYYKGGDNKYSREEFDILTKRLEEHLQSLVTNEITDKKTELVERRKNLMTKIPKWYHPRIETITNVLDAAGKDFVEVWAEMNGNIQKTMSLLPDPLPDGFTEEKITEQMLWVMLGEMASAAQDVQKENRINNWVVHQVVGEKIEKFNTSLFPALIQWGKWNEKGYQDALQTQDPAMFDRVKKQVLVFENQILKRGIISEIPIGMYGNAEWWRTLGYNLKDGIYKAGENVATGNTDPDAPIGEAEVNGESLNETVDFVGLTPINFLSPDLQEVDKKVQLYYIAVVLVSLLPGVGEGFDVAQGITFNNDLAVQILKDMDIAPPGYDIQVETWEMALNIVGGLATALGAGVLLNRIRKGVKLGGKLDDVDPEDLAVAVRDVKARISSYSSSEKGVDNHGNTTQDKINGFDNDFTIYKNKEQILPSSVIFETLNIADIGYIFKYKGKFYEIIRFDEESQTVKCVLRDNFTGNILEYNKKVTEKTHQLRLNAPITHPLPTFLSPEELEANIHSLSDADIIRNIAHIQLEQKMASFKHFHVAELEGKSLREEMKQIVTLAKDLGKENNEVIQRVRALENMNEYNKKIGGILLDLYDTEFLIAKNNNTSFIEVFNDKSFQAQIFSITKTMSKEAQKYVLDTISRAKFAVEERDLSIDPTDLLSSLFKHSPSDKVSLNTNPWAYSFVTSSKDFSALKAEVDLNYAGVEGFQTDIVEVGNIAVTSKTASDKVRDHEELHAKANTVAPFLNKRDVELDITQLERSIGEENWNESLSFARDLVRKNLKNNLPRVMDEIHSYLVGNNFSIDQITRTVLNRKSDVYAYEKHFQGRIEEIFQSAPKNTQLALNKIMSFEFDNYQRVVKNLSRLAYKFYLKNEPNSILTINLQNLADPNYERFLPIGYSSDMFQM